jgi:hypothetical protein
MHFFAYQTDGLIHHNIFTGNYRLINVLRGTGQKARDISTLRLSLEKKGGRFLVCEYCQPIPAYNVADLF